MLKELILEKSLLLFGGKGGVGKTTLAASAAVAAAQQGRNVLLVSTDPAHNLGHLFDQPVGQTIKKLQPGLSALELDPDTTVDQHLAEVTRSLRRLMPIHLAGEIDKHMDLARQSPGMHEAAMLEKMAEIIADHSSEYDLIIFDTAPSGHTSRLMALPEILGAWTDGLIARQEKSQSLREKLKNIGKKNQAGDSIIGKAEKNDDEKILKSTASRNQEIQHILHRRKHRFAHLRDALTNDQTTAFLIVLAAERLPVLESIEFYQQLKSANVPIGGLIVNKRTPDLKDDFFQKRRTQENKYLTLLNEKLPDIEMQEVELKSQDISGINALREFSHLFC